MIRVMEHQINARDVIKQSGEPLMRSMESDERLIDSIKNLLSFIESENFYESPALERAATPLWKVLIRFREIVERNNYIETQLFRIREINEIERLSRLVDALLAELDSLRNQVQAIASERDSLRDQVDDLSYEEDY